MTLMQDAEHNGSWDEQTWADEMFHAYELLGQADRAIERAQDFE